MTSLSVNCIIKYICFLIILSIGLYFSAQWCPPGRSFTPVLAEKYRRWKKEHPEFEIVFISSDRTAVDFVTYFNEMPWLAIPFDQKDVKVW